MFKNFKWNTIIINEKEKYDLKLNIGLIGDTFVGKTALSESYQNNEPFSENNIYPNISLDLREKVTNKNGKKIKILIWDIAGQE